MYGLDGTTFAWDTTIWKSGIWGGKIYIHINQNIEKIAFQLSKLSSKQWILLNYHYLIALNIT